MRLSRPRAAHGPFLLLPALLGPLLPVAALVAVGAAPVAHAQDVPPALAATVVRDPGSWGGGDLQGELLFAGANVLLGGVTAGVGRVLRGGDFWPAFAAGGAGGAVAWAGRRIGAERWTGAGLLGRSVAAVGASMVRNGAAGSPPLAYLTVPMGPLELNVRTAGGADVHARVDLWATAWLVDGALDRRYRLDGAASISRGVPVFRRIGPFPPAGGRTRVGSCIGGAVFLEEPGYLDDATLLVHEWSHVVQGDYLGLTLGAPLEDAVLGVLPGGPALARHVRFGVVVPAVRWGLGALVPGSPGQQFLETEAAFLESR